MDTRKWYATTADRIANPSHRAAIVKICSMMESSFHHFFPGLGAGIKKTRSATGSSSRFDDSTTAETCAAGVISPTWAVIKGDSIPEYLLII
jgi:hypothetical protein